MVIIEYQVNTPPAVRTQTFRLMANINIDQLLHSSIEFWGIIEHSHLFTLSFYNNQTDELVLIPEEIHMKLIEDFLRSIPNLKKGIFVLSQKNHSKLVYIHNRKCR